MPLFVKDGLTLLPELRDDARLNSNIFVKPVAGREDIGRALTSLDELYSDVVDIEHTSNADRELILSRAVLPSGLKTDIRIVGLRDKDGWIEIMTHEPETATRELTQLISQGADGQR